MTSTTAETLKEEEVLRLIKKMVLDTFDHILLKLEDCADTMKAQEIVRRELVNFMLECEREGI